MFFKTAHISSHPPRPLLPDTRSPCRASRGLSAPSADAGGGGARCLKGGGQEGRKGGGEGKGRGGCEKGKRGGGGQVDVAVAVGRGVSYLARAALPKHPWVAVLGATTTPRAV